MHTTGSPHWKCVSWEIQAAEKSQIQACLTLGGIPTKFSQDRSYHLSLLLCCCFLVVFKCVYSMSVAHLECEKITHTATSKIQTNYLSIPNTRSLLVGHDTSYYLLITIHCDQLPKTLKGNTHSLTVLLYHRKQHRYSKYKSWTIPVTKATLAASPMITTTLQYTHT